MSYWQALKARGAFDFEKSRPCAMPGLICPTCGTWALMGAALPSFPVEAYSSLVNQLRRWPLPLDKWQKLRDELQPLLPPSQVVVPGLEVGPLEGRVLNPFRIGWIHMWGFVVAEELRDELATLAPQINAVEARFENPYGGRYYELELRCHARVIPTAETSCSTCGRRGGDYPKDVLRLCDLPNLPLFRVANFPTIIVIRDDLLPFFQRELGPAATYRRAELVS
jgi:hypothetical protein